MRIVDNYHSVVFIGKIADSFKISDYTVHTENAVGNYDFKSCAVFVGFLKLSFEIFHIAVLVSVSLRLSESYAVDNACVVKLVGNDSVFGCRNRLEKTAVSVETAGIENGVVRSEEGADLGFEFLMNGLSSADETNAAHTETVLIVAGFCGCDNFGVVGKTEIVICAEVDNVVGFGRIDDVGLRRSDYTLFFP